MRGDRDKQGEETETSNERRQRQAMRGDRDKQ